MLIAPISMKKPILIFLFSLLLLSISHAQTWRRLGGWGNRLSGIVWVNENVGYMSGDQVILKTIDGGLSWKEQEAPSKNRMTGLDFFNENLGVMVGEKGQVYRTTNGGASWQLINLGANLNFNNVKFVTETKVYLVGQGGEVFRSTNSGLSWAKQSVGTTEELTSMFFADTEIGFITTSGGKVIRTLNGGNNWETIQTSTNNRLNDIYFVSPSQGYAVGNLGTIVRTINGGNSWTNLNSGTELDLLSVAFNRTNILLGAVVGREGAILRTLNGGLSFDGVNINNKQTYLDVAFRTTSNLVFAVGTNGFVISSANSGGSYTVRLSGVDNEYTGTRFRTENLGYIIGNEGKFLVTTNGGSSLVDRSRPLSIPFFDLDFPSNNFGYICGPSGTILRTSNSGSNWTSLNAQTTNSINGLFFFANTSGYAVGDAGFISRTLDSGINWEQVSGSNTTVDLRDIAFFEQQVGIVIGKGGHLGWSSGGQTWEKINVPTTENLNALKIITPQTAMVVGDRGTLLKTVDQGKTWKKITIPFAQHLKAIDFLDESVGFVAGEKGLILQTKDGGENWERMNTGTFQDFTGMSFGDLSKGYAVGEKGTLFQYFCQAPGVPTVIFGQTNVCLGQQIYSIQNLPEPDEVFEWRVDGGTVIEGQGTNRVVVRWDTPGRNAVLVRGKNNCGNGSTRGLEVIVSTQPRAITAIAGEGVVCRSSFTEYEVDDVPGTIFSWEVTGGLIREGQGTAKVRVEWTVAQQQTLKVTPTNPCGNGQAFNRTISVQDPPAQPSTISGPNKVGLMEETYQVTAVTGVNFQWTISGQGGRIVQGQGTNAVRVLWEREGNFTLTVTPMNGCNTGTARTLPVNVNIITSILEEEQPNYSLKVFPNPSQGSFNLSIKGVDNINKITLVNSLGQQLKSFVPDAGLFDFQFVDMPKGLHTLIIQTRERNHYTKVLVQ
jgi:photosystem II stability/assembly factor-like uncharacterized protein